ncbi:hypothetical protein [Roseiconus lacunae]|uniref:hypothetical protein n=1 Tax=Roseiconus lacunae TaxID=2605694 RepID=UPI001E4D94B7|nr:hypothetical protein [Roseiconus lacunae]
MFSDLAHREFFAGTTLTELIAATGENISNYPTVAFFVVMLIKRHVGYQATATSDPLGV